MASETTGKVLVVVDLERFDEVTEAAKVAGLQVETTWPVLGALHGTVSPEKRQHWKK